MRMDSLRKTFFTNGSFNHMNGKLDDGFEEEPILLNHHNILFNHDKQMIGSMDERHVALNISDVRGNGRVGEATVEQKNNILRGSNYEFWKEETRNGGERQKQGSFSEGGDDQYNLQDQLSKDDPPSKLIGQFLHKQKASGEILLDMDLEMNELSHDRRLPPILENSNQQQPISPKDCKRSLGDSSKKHFEISSESLRRRYKDNLDDEVGDNSGNKQKAVTLNSGEVLRCTSNASFRLNSSLFRSKTKSRLMDPLQDEVRTPGKSPKSGQLKTPKSGQLKSGMLGRIEEDDDDPFLDEDLPDNKFRQGKLGTVTILQWVSLFVFLVALVCSLTIPYLARLKLWDMHLWKWVLMVLVLICGRLISGWGIHIVVYFLERNFLLRKRVLYFVYGVRRAVQNCLWLGLVLVAWHYIFDNKVERETKSNTLHYVTKILVCLLVSTLVWLVKTLLVKVLASSFHVSAYFDRIQDSLFNQYVIQTLSGPPLIEIEQIQEEEEKVMAEVQTLQNAGAELPADLRASALPSGRMISSGRLQRSPKIATNSKITGVASMPEDVGITIDHLHKLNQKNISAWNMKRLMNIVRHGVLSTLDERIQDENAADESATHISSEVEAKAAAKKIFHNVANPGSKYIYLVDLMRFMREDEAIKTMGLFEGANENKRVSKTALKNWVVNAFRERRALSLTLNDTKTAVNKLHQMVNFVVAIILVVIWLLILGIATTHLLVFVSSQLLLVVFIFGNTCKTVFEAIIFLFAMHPFDVGDRCEIDGVQMIVEEMNILTTVFLRYDNQKITYPNTVLATKPISNYYRSPDMGEAVEFCIHIATPVEKVLLMKERIKGYIESKKEHWYPNPTVVIKDMVDMNKLTVAVWLQHRMNHQDMGERWVRRASLVEHMIKVLRELDVEYRLAPLDINVRNMPSLTSTRLPSTWATFA